MGDWIKMGKREREVVGGIDNGDWLLPFGWDMISEKESEEEQEKNIRTLLVGGIDNGYWL